MATPQEALLIALEHHQAGRLTEAETLYGRILEAVPDQPDALHLHGVLAAQTGRLPLAAELIAKAVAARAGVADYHTNLGNVLRLLGRVDEAIEHYGRAVALAPDLPRVQADLGILLNGRNRRRDAEAPLVRAVLLDPSLAEAHVHLGQIHEHGGDLDKGARHYRHAAALRPDLADISYNLGILEHARGRPWAAAEAVLQALAAKPDFPEAWYNLGNARACLDGAGQGAGRNARGAETAYRMALALQPDYAEAFAALADLLQPQAGRTADAVAACRRALRQRPDLAAAYDTLAALRLAARDKAALRSSHRAVALTPGNAGSHVNLGRALRAAGAGDAAVAAFTRALTLAPDCAPALSNLVIVHRERDDLDEAVRTARRAIALLPDSALALTNLGVCLQYGAADAALACFGRALRIAPGDAEVRRLLGLLQMECGILAEGFANYEWRWSSSGFDQPRRSFPQPRWDGGDLAGRRLLLWGEQGVGDELIYSGMIPDLIEAGVDCALECDPRLVPILQRSFPAVEVVPRTPALNPPDLSRPAGVHCPLGSIGRWLRPDVSRFPSRASYLVADGTRRRRIRDRYGAEAPGNLLVGVSWRSKNTDFGRNKSLDLLSWAPLLTQPGITFVNLQYGDCREDLEAVRRALGVTVLADAEIDAMRDLDGFAAQVAALDLVISTSNTTVHMAGGLGVPTWVLLPAGQGRIWYWFDGRDDSPWYPSLRLFRQRQPGDWRPVVDRLATALAWWQDDQRSRPSRTTPL